MMDGGFPLSSFPTYNDFTIHTDNKQFAKPIVGGELKIEMKQIRK